MVSTDKHDAIIFDLGDVLFSWSPQTKTTISPKLLRKFLDTATWHDYERGLVSQQDCYRIVGEQFSVDPAEISRAFDQARDSLEANNEVIAIIQQLKSQSDGQLRVFAMSNIGQPDYDVLRTKPADWSIFDEVFTSCGAGHRKPDLGFYRHVIEKTGVNPKRTVFVDDKFDNVVSAQSQGLCGIVFDNSEHVIQQLLNLFGNPVTRGQDFLRQNAGRLESVIDDGSVLPENFAQLLILETTADKSLVKIVEHPKTWNFFVGTPVHTTEQFPHDLDTTSIGCTTLKREAAVLNLVMDKMLRFRNRDGILQTYFDSSRSRIDPIVCVNALTLFYTNGRGHELTETLDWVKQVLENRAYLSGTRYYTTAECFLYFLSRLINSTVSPDVRSMKPLLRARVMERIGAEGDALALAMRVLTCAAAGVPNTIDLPILLSMQELDGSFGIGWIYKYGKTGLRIGNRGLTTALALKALESQTVWEPLTYPPSPSTDSSESVSSDSPSSSTVWNKSFGKHSSRGLRFLRWRWLH